MKVIENKFLGNLNDLARNYPGLSISIVKEDRIYYKTYGFMNKESKKEVSKESRFLIASISKLFTAVAVLQLQEKGLINIDNNINDYINQKIYHKNGSELIIKDILSHYSGLGDGERGLRDWRSILSNYPISLEDHVKQNISSSRQIWGERGFYHYSNAGFTLLGYLVEQVSKTNFNDYCKENIFGPLQMNESSFLLNPNEKEELDNICTPYSFKGDKMDHYCVAEYPSCQMRSSIQDLSKFLVLFTTAPKSALNNILSPRSIQLMLPENFKVGLAWWGMDAIYGVKEEDVWTHGGFMDGVRTHILFEPSTSSGYIILINGECVYNKVEYECRKLMKQLD